MLTKLVCRGDPAHATVAPVVNPVPLTVKVKAVVPTVVEAGVSDVSVGRVGAMIAKLAAPGLWPSGFVTITCAVPVAATSLAEIAALSCVALIYVVVRALLFHCTVEPETNPDPFTVSVKPAPPALTLPGLIELIAGAATGGGGVGLTPLPELPQPDK